MTTVKFEKGVRFHVGMVWLTAVPTILAAAWMVFGFIQQLTAPNGIGGLFGSFYH